MATVLEILGSLGIFLYGMKVMSEGIQKVSGEQLRGMMAAVTRNRFSGITMGTLITGIIQSSSATTVMVVSFVNANLLTLRQSIGVIMGANLGTTATFWIISFLGLKFSMSSVALPIIGLALPMIFMKSPRLRDIGETLIGFGLLFLGLSFLKDSVPDIKNHPEVLDCLQHWTSYGFFSVLIFMGFGVLLTVVVQSSSVAGAITLTLAYKGWIDFPMACAIVMGENIGTTITAYLASLGANTNAKRAARAHFMFNVIGVLWMLCIFYWFVDLVDFLMPGDVTSLDDLPNHTALFHTLFNLTNILILNWFIPQLVDLVTWMVPEKEPKKPTHILQHISLNNLSIGELNLIEAQKEVDRMGKLSEKMFKSFLEVYHHPEEDLTEKVREIKRQEELADDISIELTDYLIRCSRRRISDYSVGKVVALTRVVAELEAICDLNHHLTGMATRRYKKNQVLESVDHKELDAYAEQVLNFFAFLRSKLSTEMTAADLQKARDLEKDIKSTLKLLRKSAINRMSQQGSQIKAELLYVDILNCFERIGNHVYNVLQVLAPVDGSR